MRILLVGGTWNNELDENGLYGKSSSLVEAVYNELSRQHQVNKMNGGRYDDLSAVIDKCKDNDIVFWWANVPNDLPKIRDVKEVAPKVMLVTSKRNDGDKYNFMELTQHALARKANLVFEFKRITDNLFNIRVFDPLGCMWFDGTDISMAVSAAMNRLEYLRSITRQSTIQSSTDKNLVLAWYFDQFKQPQYQSKKAVEIPDETKFVDIVRKHAETFYQLMNPGKDIKRFLGNASMRPAMPPQVGRCSRGMPSFRNGDYIFVSQRNIDKQFISLDNFVPCYMENGKLYYCGDNKPSVDAPIQVRLYGALPNIKYIIHSHCYIDGAPFTNKSIPCGAIEEVDEVLDLINREYGDRKSNFYTVNLKGHGSLLMSNEISMMENVKYISRQLPENFM